MMKNAVEYVKRSAAVAAVGLVASLGLMGSAKAEEGSVDVAITPWHDVDTGANTVKVRIDKDLDDHLSVYSWRDFKTSPDKPFDFEANYGESALTYRPEKDGHFGLRLRHDDGTDFKGMLRLGAEYHGSLGKGNFTSVRYFPLSTSDKFNHQVELYTSQELTDRLTADFFDIADLKPGTLYGELGLDLKLDKDGKTKLFIQEKMFHDGGRTDYNTVVGLRFDL